MASTIEQRTVPSFYSSANDDVIYEFDFIPIFLDSVSNNGGNAQLNPTVSFVTVPVVGEKIYIASNLYTGTFKVLSASAGDVTIDTPYIGTITSLTYYCYLLRVPTIYVYKGYLGGEKFPTELPYALVTSLKPSVVYSTTTGLPYLSINIKGLTRYMFNIESNTVANSTDFSMFNAIRLIFDNESTVFSTDFDYTLVLNTAISNSDLNYKYVGTGIVLSPLDKPLIATTGVTFVSAIQSVSLADGCVPIIYKYVNGILQ